MAQIETVFEWFSYFEGAPVAALWCHGVPGPLVMNVGYARVLLQASPAREERETANPTWPLPPAALLRGSTKSIGEPARWVPDWWDPSRPIDWPKPQHAPRAPYRATQFTKPALTLRPGDYVRVHSDRWPESDQDIDEGFALVAELWVVDSEVAPRLFADPDWHTQLVVVFIPGLPGVLLLHADDEVTALAYVNPERQAYDRNNARGYAARMVFAGSCAMTEEERRAADAADMARRPLLDESHLYPSWYRDPLQRRLALEGRYGLRIVPLSDLPWPHSQGKCAMEAIARAQPAASSDLRKAHAEAFLTAEGRQAMETCRYHQANWPRLARIAEECAHRWPLHQSERALTEHPEYAFLSKDERRWLWSLFDHPIKWSDGAGGLTNGQHRLCAMRAAGVKRCLVEGNYLPHVDEGG